MVCGKNCLGKRTTTGKQIRMTGLACRRVSSKQWDHSDILNVHDVELGDCRNQGPDEGDVHLRVAKLTANSISCLLVVSHLD